MPHLIYLSNKDSFRSRLYLHVERVLSAWWGILGYCIIVYILAGGRTFHSPLNSFHWTIVLGTAIFLALSGSLISYSLFNLADSTAWRYERLGWTIGLGGWTAFGIAMGHYGDSIISASFILPMIGLCIVRLKSLGKTESNIRSVAGA